MKKEQDSKQLQINQLRNLILAIFMVLAWAAPTNARLMYNGSILSEEDNNGNFRQSSNQNLTLSLRQQITDFLALNEVLRYNNQLTEPLARTERLSPSIDVVNANSFFRLNFSVSSFMDLENNDKPADNSYYQMGFSSKWEADLVPDLQIVASQRKKNVNRALGQSGEERNLLSTTLDWSAGALSMYYNHRWNEDIAPLRDLLLTSESNNGHLDFIKSYWGEKIRLRFSQEYVDTKLVREAAPTGGGLISQTIAEVRTGTDVTPADPFEDPAVVVNPGMRDGNLAATAFGVVSNSSFNNIVLAVTGGQVDQIHLYTLTNLGATPLTGLTWTLFSNDFLGTTWDPVTPSITGVTYNSTMQRFEIDVAALSVNYLKLVLDIPLTGPSFDFTEVQVFDSRIATTSENVFRNTSNRTVLNLGGLISGNWSYNYRGNLYAQETEGASLYEQSQKSHGGDLKYNSTDGTFFSVLAVSIFENKTVRESKVAENDTVNYSLDLDKHFLPTLSAGIGWDLTELSVASVRHSETSSYRLDSQARLYPDLDLSLTITSRESEILQNSLKTSMFSTELILASRVKPGLVLTLKEVYAERENGFSSSPDSQVYDSSITVQWRPTDNFYVNGVASYLANDLPEPNQVSLTLDMDLSVSSNVLLEFDYSAIRALTVSEAGDVSLNWFPKRGFLLEGGCKYSHVSGQSGKDLLAYGRLAVNFAMP